MIPTGYEPLKLCPAFSEVRKSEVIERGEVLKINPDFSVRLIKICEGAVVMSIALLIALIGCGGGGGGDGSTPTPPPARPPVNARPTVDAGIDQRVDEGSEVLLSGVGTDSDGSIVSYNWVQESGIPVTLLGAASQSARFTAPDVEMDEVLVFRLTVTDDDGSSNTDTVSVTVTNSFIPPSAPGVISGTLEVGEGYTLDGDTRDESDLVVENNSLQGQTIIFPVTVAGYADSFEDQLDIYRVTLSGSVGIALTIADLGDADLDLYLAHIDGTIIDQSIGFEQFEFIQTDSTLRGEFLVTVRAYEGGSNYILSLGLGTTGGMSSNADLRLDAEFVPNEVIVKFADGVNAAQRQASETFMAGDVRLTTESVSPSGPILMKLQNAVSGRLSSETGGSGIAPLKYATTELEEKARTLQTIKSLRRNSAVLYAEPNYIRYAMTVPDDEYYGYQWHYRQINLPAAWDITKGDDDVVIAVIDTGLILDHPDLADRVLRDSSRAVIGYDFVSDPLKAGDGDGPDPDPTDPGDFFEVIRGGSGSFHGTHVAGTIGAATNNDIGVAGVTWRGKLMPLRVLGIDGSGTTFDIVDAIRYAARLPNSSRTLPFKRADVINMSLGNPSCGGPAAMSEEQAIRDAQNAGVVVVVAAGNENCGQPSGYSRIEGVISVSAVDAQGNKADYSNYGPGIDVAAPGGDKGVDTDGDGYVDGVLSTDADGFGLSTKPNYDFLQGTSMAAPHVAGVVALMLSVNPDLTLDDVNRLLAGTHDDPNAGPITRDIGAAGRDDIYGYGLIDAHRAVQVAQRIRPGGDSPQPSPPRLSVFPESLNFGATETELQLQLRNTGVEELAVTGITADESWLTVNDSSFPKISVQVDRTGLQEGPFFGSVSITSTGGDRTVRVFMQNRLRFSGGDIGTVYILVVDPNTQETIEQAITNAGQGYVYRTPEVPAGTYAVIAGTDRDFDNYICDSGEACGVFPLLSDFRAIEVDGDQTGINFSVSIDLLSNTQSQRTGLIEMPSTGFRRLRTEDFKRLP